MSDVNDLDIELNKALDDLVPADEKPAEPTTDPYEDFKREMRMKPGRWYVIHSYAGYEKRVKTNLENRIQSLNMEDYIHQVEVPMEEVTEIKNAQRKTVRRVRIQGYVLVRMDLTDESWGAVRHTPGVTGFVGSGTEPTPVSDQEIAKIKKRMGVEDPKYNIEFSEGEVVSITDGPFKGFDGAISEIDAHKGKLKVMVSMFGRDTPVELDALQVKKV